jgi:hypothetical protein
MKLKKIRKLIPSYARNRIRVIQYKNHEAQGFWLSEGDKYLKYADYQIVEMMPYKTENGTSLICVVINSDENKATE